MGEGRTGWLAERIPVEKLGAAGLLRDKEVPVHRMSWAYYLGGLALFFFALQVASGLLLLFYYEPTVSDAHASVEHLTRHVGGGALVRNLHTWSASAMILAVLLHLLTTFGMKAFARPREVTWWSGLALAALAFGFGFTGYLLPWHQIAVNATKVGLQSIEGIAPYLPSALAALPARLRELVQGDAAVGQATLSRFYALHVVVLPLLFGGGLLVHLLGVQVHGMARGDRAGARSERFFPSFLLKDLEVWGAAFLVLFVLALALPFEAFFPYPLFAAYQAGGATPDGIKPEWYFYFVYYPLELLPFWAVAAGMAALAGVLAAAPWLFRDTSRRTLGVLAGLGAAYLAGITLFGQRVYEFLRGAP